ncbi:hypothetical protein CFP56_006913 [Quercus suber]|uniref:Uncharacterized protein n=1 Tax=Quercus suber TaxID=58331 RepID=A0AAW0M7B2_QUESU
MAVSKSINIVRTASPSLIKELMACDRTVKVDSYEKMDWISGKRSDIASYRSNVRNIFSGFSCTLPRFRESKQAYCGLFGNLREARLSDRI